MTENQLLFHSSPDQDETNGPGQASNPKHHEWKICWRIFISEFESPL